MSTYRQPGTVLTDHTFLVPRRRTAAAIRGLLTRVASEYEHDGLRVSDGKVLDRLIAMARGDA